MSNHKADKGEKMVRICASVKPQTDKKLRLVAERCKMSYSQVIDIALECNLDSIIDKNYGAVDCSNREQLEKIFDVVRSIYGDVKAIQNSVSLIEAMCNQEIESANATVSDATLGIGNLFNQLKNKGAHDNNHRMITSSIKAEKVEKLLGNFRVATEEMEEVICRILS